MNSRLPLAMALLIVASLLGGLGTVALGGPGGTDAYILGPGDAIEILVVGDRDLSQTVTIKPDGSIDLPLVGEVRAAGRTTTQLAAELNKRYSVYLKAPSITVAVRQLRVDRIYILGQVNRPGEYQIRPGVGILELLASAGGPTDRADLAKATIIRGKTEMIELSPPELSARSKSPEAIELNLLGAFATNKNPEVQLLPGDVLFVPATDRRIVVLGQVNRPGAYDLLEGQRVTDLLAAAGGMTAQAAPQRAFIVRNDEQIPVDVREILAGNLEGNIPLLQGDMMVVPESQDRIAVLGAVNRPGRYDYDLVKGMKLIDAIALAGGQSESGNLSQVGIVRLEGGKTKTIAANLTQALSGQDMSQNLPLRPGDVVYVPERGMTLTKAAQFFSIVGTLRYIFGIF